jgi:hypothetical protein
MSNIPIINERPEGMDFELYKALRRLQNKRLKMQKRGVFTPGPVKTIDPPKK